MTNPTRIKGEAVFEDSQSHLVHSKVFKDKITSATPKVSNVTRFVCEHAGATTVTNFVGGAEGQTIKLLGHGNTTIEHNSLIKTNTGANKTLSADIVYTFTMFNGVWYENE
jgi:hypothetical protein